MSHVRSIVAALAVLALPAGLAAQATKPAPAKPAPNQPAASKPSPNKQAAVIQGTWIVVSINGNQQAPGTPDLTLTFTGDKYHQSVGADVNERGTVKVDASKQPMTIDLAITEGQDAGKAQLGIIDVAGDELRANFDMPNAGKRPADFAAREGTLSIVARRKKS